MIATRAFLGLPAIEAVSIAVTESMKIRAVPHAAHRAKRTDLSPAMYWDVTGPDRDFTGVICEYAWYHFRFGDWNIRAFMLDAEIVKRGLCDNGEDDVGINVRGSFLPQGRKLERQHLLVSVDARNSGKCYPHWRYVAAFYEAHMDRVWLAGYISGERLMERYPEPRKITPDGFLSHIAPVTALRPVTRIPYVGMLSEEAA